MSISIPRTAVVVVLLGGVWWLAREGWGGRDDPGGSPAADAPDEVSEAMRSRLELAVTSAAHAAECSTEPGSGERTPEEAARRLVALMKSASATPGGEEPPPGTAIDYVEDLPGAPWQVAVRPDSAAEALLIEGYGPDLSTPLVRRRVPCS